MSAEIQLELKEIVKNLHKNKAVSTSSRQNIIVYCLHCVCVCDRNCVLNAVKCYKLQDGMWEELIVGTFVCYEPHLYSCQTLQLHIM